MKAAQINDYGDPEVLRTVGDVPEPAAGKGQVLVEVHAAAANPWDWKVRQGLVKDSIPLKLPATLGGDLSGVVVAVGEGATDFKTGDEVYGAANSMSGQGAFAEFAPADVSHLAPKPANVDFVTAAALPLASASAYIGLIELINLQSGQKILIHGGAGGIGSMAVQLAKHLGAYVATTVGADDLEYAKELGADEAIDYSAEDFTRRIHDFDAVFDTVGGETAIESYGVLRRGGVLASMVEPVHDDLAEQHGIKALYESSKVTGDRLRHITELVESDALKINVDKTFPLEQAGEALGYLQHGHPRGKVVIKVR